MTGDAGTTTDRAARFARNQSLFRVVNERVKDINEAFSIVAPLGDWVCECADPACTDRISLSPAEYESVRADGTRFVISPADAHVFGDVEDIVARHERYWIVEKVGGAAEVAADIDPRPNSAAG